MVFLNVKYLYPGVLMIIRTDLDDGQTTSPLKFFNSNGYYLQLPAPLDFELIRIKTPGNENLVLNTKEII